ncbi:MAG TPA: metallophosphoesterase [Bryobacteraceae bacterium]|nr:metallophosphoesterase [Bryobacteraceae bacterium]
MSLASSIRFFPLFLSINLTILVAQQPAAATLSTDRLLSEAGPTFRIAQNQLPNPPTLVVYGDQRFTDPANTRQTNPRIRQWLVNQIAHEHPAAVIMNGDVPLAGNVANDYAVFTSETKPWRDLRIPVFPALGNHEFHGDPAQCLENWWNTFPEMRNRRWYSVQLGSRVYVIALDSDTSLLPGSNQARWLEKQINDLPPSVDFVIISLHHPPVADVQEHIEVSHNPRPNEIALRDYLSKAARISRARFLVSAGHIHNYERIPLDDVMYLVSGGGGAPPYVVERGPDDLYKSALFPNYHYLKLSADKDRLHGEMYRVDNPEAANLSVELKDSFEIPTKPR